MASLRNNITALRESNTKPPSLVLKQVEGQIRLSETYLGPEHLR